MTYPIAVIPARYASARLPGKPLRKIRKKPLIQIIYENAVATGLFEDVIVATDDNRIFDAVHSFNGKVEMTSSHYSCGTERVAKIAQNREVDIVVNIQCDELFIEKEPLQQLLNAFDTDEVMAATLIHPTNDLAIINNPNRVKVVFDTEDNAIYFSRSPIPYYRDKSSNQTFFRHIGVYAFRRDTLLQIASLPQSNLEKIEKLEQLRLLENGMKIKVVKTEYNGFSIDTEEDLKKAAKIIREKEEK
ncbi:MAG: 3-deoxy-manno-octulosonate cytidylyltransferase [Candidatus Cloacimonadia bacterium]